MGLGPYPAVTLAQARVEALRHSRTRAAGKDPLRLREQERQDARLQAARSKTFEQAAQEFIASREGRWKNEKHRQQWLNTLATYVYPVIGPRSVATIGKDDVLEVLNWPVNATVAADGRELRPCGTLWEARPDTAVRIRGRIEAVLDWARFKDYRSGDNPARWRGNLDFALKKFNKANHHAALPYDQVAAFLGAVRARPGLAPMALEFLILTAARTNEVLGAAWGEFDEGLTVWTVPASRMKAGKEHRVPLSTAAREVLTRAKALKRGDFVFPSASAKHPLSNMALLALLRRMERTDITVHGFRSGFRDWAADCTSFPADVAEMALAHTVGDAVIAAYKRTDLFGKRRALMEAWADYANDREGATVHFIAGRVA